MLSHRERLSKRRTQSDLAALRMASAQDKRFVRATRGVARHNAVDTPALLPDGNVTQALGLSRAESSRCGPRQSGPRPSCRRSSRGDHRGRAQRTSEDEL